MEEVKLSTAANQDFTFERENCVYFIYLRSFGGITLSSVSKDGRQLTNSLPCVRDGWLIPFEWQTGDGGNFRFESSAEDYPVSGGFGSRFHLMYYTRAEYLAARNG